MYNVDLENSLIIIDIADTIADLCSIQLDVDNKKLKAAELIVQRVDLARLIGKANVERCVDPVEDADIALKELITLPLCYFTYSRCLEMFNGEMTDSGFEVAEGASLKGADKANGVYYGLAETLMADVFDFLELETPNDTQVKPENLTPKIRVMGGKEFRET